MAAATLYAQLVNAKRLFMMKRKAFETLCKLYAHKLPEWNDFDRMERKLKGKEIQCVYRQSEKNVPSQSRIYGMLITELASASAKQKDSKGSTPSFLNEGICILAEQRQIRIQLLNRGSVETEDVARRQKRLSARIDNWRKMQKTLTPQLGDLVATQAVARKAVDAPECEILYLPSELSPSQRNHFGLGELAEIEGRLHEGAAYDAIQQVRTLVKVHTAMVAKKKKSEYGQKRHTRASGKVQDIKVRRDMAMADYNAARDAMISLGFQDVGSFPPLTENDIFRKPTHLKRAVGDSRRMDGFAWTNAGVSGGSRPVVSLVSNLSQPFGTQLVKSKRRDAAPSEGQGKGKKRRIDFKISVDESACADKTGSSPNKDGCSILRT